MNLRDGWRTEASPLGRILIAPAVPTGAAVFYTSADFDGRLSTSAVEKILAFIRDRFGVEATLATCHQVHGTSVQQVGGRASGWCESETCDALFTAEKNVALGIKVADCLPVTVLDSGHSISANIHAGWRGAAAEIIDRTLDRLRAETSFEPSAARVWLGPSIRDCCFEVGEEVVEQFALSDPAVERFVDRSRRGPRPYLDLVSIARVRLLAAGIADGSIHDSGVCTRCTSGFHSYRRDRAASGRNLAIVAQ